MIIPMETIHVTDVEAVRDFAGLLRKVRNGVEVVIEHDAQAIAVVQAPAPPRRSMQECLALLPEHSPALVDEDFARDVEEAIASHREPLGAPTWD